MPTVTLNKKTVFKLLGKKLPDNELFEKIPMLGTDLEEITDEEIIVEIFPNRPDMLSEQGFARAFSSFLGLKTGLKKFDMKSSGEKVIIDSTVAEVRPYTACAIVKNMTFTDEVIKEVIQIQEKLHVSFGRNRKKVAIGIYPMEDIKMPITFKAKLPNEIKFKPLEASRDMTGLEILSRHPTGKEYAHLLEGKKVFPIFEDAKGDILSMPPIINSEKTGRVTEKTKDVFIECSGSDFRVLKLALNMIVSAFNDMGGDVQTMELEYHSKSKDKSGKEKVEKIISPDFTPEEFELDLAYINNLLGLTLNEKEAEKYLSMMGHGFVKSSGKKKPTVLVPAYRADVMHNADFAEDIAIAYGYDNFEAIIPEVATIAKESNFEVFKRRICNILVGLGLLETKTYNLSSREKQEEKMLIENPKIVELANALTIDFNILRSWVTPSLLNVLNFNKSNEYPQKIFDMGRVYSKTDNPKSETGILEQDRLGVMICDKEVDFTKIKQVLDVIAHALDFKYEIKETEHKSFIPGRVARVSVNGNNVAYVGEIHPQVLENFEIEVPAAALELNLSELFKEINLE